MNECSQNILAIVFITFMIGLLFGSYLGIFFAEDGYGHWRRDRQWKKENKARQKAAKLEEARRKITIKDKRAWGRILK